MKYIFADSNLEDKRVWPFKYHSWFLRLEQENDVTLLGYGGVDLS